MDLDKDRRDSVSSISNQESNEKVQSKVQRLANDCYNNEINQSMNPQQFLEKADLKSWEEKEQFDEEDDKKLALLKKEDDIEDPEKKNQTHYVDDKIYIIVKNFLAKDVKGLALKRKLGISIHPVKSCLTIYYHDQKNYELFLSQLFQFIQNIQFLEVPAKIVVSGFYLSNNYRQNLKKEQIFIFQKDKKYYIGGCFSKRTLKQKLVEINKINFSWLKLFSFPNTRSYRCIFEKIFQRAEFVEQVQARFKAKKIQVACDYQRKNDDLAIVMIKEDKARSTLLKIDENWITNYIKKNYLICCFILKYEENQSKRHRYFGKDIDDKGISMFFIHENHSTDSYLFIITLKEKIRDVIPILEKEIKEMKLPIVGRRYFKNLAPEFNKQGMIIHSQKIVRIPASKNYSLGVISKQFDWKRQLENMII